MTDRVYKSRSSNSNQCQIFREEGNCFNRQLWCPLSRDCQHGIIFKISFYYFEFQLLLCWIIIGFDVHFDKIQRDVLLSKFHNLEPYVMFQVFHSTSWTSLKSQLRTLFILEMAVVGTPQNSFQKCCKNIGNSWINIYLFFCRYGLTLQMVWITVQILVLSRKKCLVFSKKTS